MLSKFTVAYNFNDRWWSELRLYSNTLFDDITPELVLCYNVVKKDRHRIYLGFGGTVNFFNGFVLPMGVQFSPIEKLDRFSLHIEWQPLYDVDAEDFLLQSSWDIRYMFGKKE